MPAFSTALALREPVDFVVAQRSVPPEWEALRRDIIDVLDEPDDFGRSQVDRWRSLFSAIQGIVNSLADPSEVAGSDEISAEVVCLARLSGRQRQVMELVVAGRANKAIAHLLNISRRTAENHRAVVMKKTGSRTLPDLVRLAVRAQQAQGK